MQELKFILNQYKRTIDNMKVTKNPKGIYRIDILLGNRTVYFEPLEGYFLSNKTAEVIHRVIDRRDDLPQIEDGKSQLTTEEKYLNPDTGKNCQLANSGVVEPICQENITDGLKIKMSYREMEGHMRKNSYKIINRVNVGLYAKRLGYKVYKPMINGRIYHFYVKY